MAFKSGYSRGWNRVGKATTASETPAETVKKETIEVQTDEKWIVFIGTKGMSIPQLFSGDNPHAIELSDDYS